MRAPTVTRADVLELLASPGEDPVLYLSAGPDDEGGELQTQVWVAAYVQNSKILVHRHEVVDAIGDSPDRDSLEDYVTQLQSTADERASVLE
ncbi:hypothetical protein ACFQ6U_13450 [Streptomyces sp. NPDC056465]|uniref:hypothetical protein n=1 Tax=unclassified Streptomyces TaxID=2593676 RepID=UPI0035DFDA04